jgi:hypothetical protein
MANRYWVGGSASWDATAGTKWALTSGGAGGEAVPTAADDVYFDAASGAVTITLSGAITCLSFDSTGFTGTVAGTGTLAVSANAIYGAGATFTNTGAWTFNATSGTQQITTNGKTLDNPITQNGVGATVQLQDNLTMGSTRTYTLTNGTLDLNNQTLSAGIFNSTNSNTRSIAFGTGNITVTGNGAFVWATFTVTNLTTTGTQVVNSTYSGSTGTRSFAPGALSEANSISFNVSAGTDIVTFSNGSLIRNLDLTGFSGTFSSAGGNSHYGNLLISATTTLTGTATKSFIGTSGTQQITTNGKTLDFSMIQNGVGGTVQLQDNFTLGTAR